MRAVVLSGGGTRGALQAGALGVLLGAGLEPELLVGTSVGAINAAFLAAGPTPARAAALSDLWGEITGSDIFPGSRAERVLRIARRQNHLYPAAGLRRLIERHLSYRRIEDAAVPIVIVAAATWPPAPSAGSPRDRSSRRCSPAPPSPGCSPPVAWEGDWLCDGGIVANVPFAAALAAGADEIWVLDASGPCTARQRAQSAIDVALQALAVMGAARTQAELACRPGLATIHHLGCSAGPTAGSPTSPPRPSCWPTVPPPRRNTCADPRAGRLASTILLRDCRGKAKPPARRRRKRRGNAMTTKTTRRPPAGRRAARGPGRTVLGARRPWLWAGVATLVVAVLLAVATTRSDSGGGEEPVAGGSPAGVSVDGQGSAEVGGQAPAFSVQTLAGSRFAFPTGKPTALFFLAGWCGSCVPEAQALDRIQRELGDEVAILAVSIDPSETPRTLSQFIDAVGEPAYPFAIDNGGALLRAFDARSLDTTIVVDAAGRVVFRDGVPTDESTLRTALARAGLA